MHATSHDGGTIRAASLVRVSTKGQADKAAVAGPRLDELMRLSDAEVGAVLSEFVLDSWHAAGSCRMGGSDDPAAVVDPEARVRGTDGLRVADASIMPVMIRANTVMTTMMIGEHVSRMIIAGGASAPLPAETGNLSRETVGHDALASTSASTATHRSSTFAAS